MIGPMCFLAFACNFWALKSAEPVDFSASALRHRSISLKPH